MTQTEWREIFGGNLASILEERKMSQAQLAREAGLSTSRISDYINGWSTPSIFATINIAHALDINIDELINFDERID